MLIAIPEWNGRISPVYDEARYFRIFEVEAGRIISEKGLSFKNEEIYMRMEEFLRLRVDTIICGAISHYQQSLAEMNGIRIISFIAGEVDEVLSEWISGNWQKSSYYMPGCRRRKRMNERGHRQRCGRSGKNRNQY